MSDAKHTKGPWRIIPEHEAISRWIVGDESGESIADCSPAGPWWNPEEADANAHLIAAAPELLEILMLILESERYKSVFECTCQPGFQPDCNLVFKCYHCRALAYIAKAKGKSEFIGKILTNDSPAECQGRDC
jgi:hypothetical protein